MPFHIQAWYSTGSGFIWAPALPRVLDPDPTWRSKSFESDSGSDPKRLLYTTDFIENYGNFQYLLLVKTIIFEIFRIGLLCRQKK
jgi:hypothetical protein